VHDGRFGWLDARGTFRPVAIGLSGAPHTCGSRRPDLNGRPFYDVLSPITDPAAPEARRKTTVVWGMAGSRASSVVIRLGGRRHTARRSAHGAFLALADGGADAIGASAVVHYADRTVRLPAPTHSSGPLGAAPGQSRGSLAARAPDPNGGLPFALLTRRDAQGGWCTWTGPRVVGDEAGSVDYQLDTFDPVQASGGGGCSGRLTAVQQREHPVIMSWTTGGGVNDEPGADRGGPGHVARRTQPGLSIYGGVAAPDVVAVTLETPRDVRTLVPSGPAHAILAVYDGSFPAGDVRVIARYRDGHVHTETLPGGP
jgi:hypothetical protein